MSTDTTTTATTQELRRPELRQTGLLHQSWTIVRRNLRHIRRQPEALTDVTIQPIMFVVLFAFVFGGSIQTEGSDYREWLLPGIMAQTMAFSSFVVAIGLNTDIDKGIVDRFRSLPISRASVLVGLDQYVDQIRDLLRPGTRVLESGLGAEEERARTAVEEARKGQAVALIGSGDAGVYAMASPALAEASDDIDVIGVPGVTAALAAAAILGAPLGHDHVSISLSDLHTPWEVIERRVRAAAEADIVVTFYNPRSRGRDWQLPKALAILAEHREPATPVGVVRNASRPDESARLTTLAALDPATVDMMTVVTVGNTATRDIAGRMVTPRGYRWQEGTK